MLVCAPLTEDEILSSTNEGNQQNDNRDENDQEDHEDHEDEAEPDTVTQSQCLDAITRVRQYVG